MYILWAFKILFLSSAATQVSCLVQEHATEMEYLKVNMQGLQVYCSVKPDLPGHLIFAWPKMIASFSLKLVCIFDDKSCVKSCGMFTGELLALNVPN